MFVRELRRKNQNVGSKVIMAMTLITNSATTDSTDLSSISFTSGIDSTYKLYIFKFIDINPATDGAEFTVNFSYLTEIFKCALRIHLVRYVLANFSRKYNLILCFFAKYIL